MWVGMPPNVTSSTRVRQSIANGDDIAAQMTAPGVLAYAREHGLYVN